MSFERELAVCRRLAREAGAIALSYRDGGELGVEMKPGDEPVTAADRAASELIVSGLAQAFPDDVIISEESADDLRRLTHPRVWYIDPIDGTKDFIRGRDGFSVMIGLAVDAVPVVGVLYQPVGDNLFWAAPGQGAWIVPPDQEPRRLACSAVTEVSELRLVASRSHRSPKIDEVKSALGIESELNIGSVGLKLALIALAERDLYVNPASRCKTWDTCAPEALLREAGGRITDIAGNALRYDQENSLRADGLVATNGCAHDAVIASLAPLFSGSSPGEPA